jgi:hypothetical protein
LEPIADSCNKVQRFDENSPSHPWKHYNSQKPKSLNSLSQIDHKYGFWIHIKDPDGVLFIYSGLQPTEDQTVDLYPGWNLVGFPSHENKNRTTGLNNIDYGADVDAIWTYDKGSNKWLKLDGPNYIFEVGNGYWIHSKVTKTWTVPL